LGHQIFQEQTSEHAVGAVLNELIQAQAILTADDIMAKGRRDALDLAVSSFVHKFNAQVPNTGQYAELYRWFDSYQLAIHYFLVAAANPDATTRPLAETKAVERAATPLRDGLLKTYVPNVAALILEIRRYEKDYLLRHDQASIDNLHRALEAVRQAFVNSNVAQSHIDDVNRTLNNYLETFDALLAIDRRLEDLSDRLQAESRQVEDSVAETMATSDTNNQQSEVTTRQMARLASRVSIGICLAALAIGLWLTLIINRSINRPLQKVLEALQLISQGDYSARISLPARDEIGRLSTMFNHMAENIKGSQWLNSGRSLLAEELREDKTEEHLARDIISFLAQYLNVQAGAFHVTQADRSLHLTASFAGTPGDNFPMVVQPGEGLIGEAARSQRLLVIDQLPADFLRL
jgi:methyl-accepting chemotaxis protein